MRLEGKTALITGSSQGIGKGIALRYAAEGAEVVINYRKGADEAQKTLKEIEAKGGKAFVCQADVSKLADITRLMDESFAHFGKLDILVNNAGVEIHADFWEVTEADYEQVIRVNQTGPFFTTQRFVQHLRETKRPGKIINISSVHEELPFPHFTPYCMSKGAMKMMMRNLAVELGPLGITVNNIAPGAIETPINTKLLNDPKLLNALLSQIPMGRLGNVDDVAGLAVFLASSEADYVTASTYYVDGGLLWNYHEQ
jgi:glucose 1-dehydrogenase